VPHLSGRCAATVRRRKERSIKTGTAHIYELDHADRFVPVILREANRTAVFYGGDQAWFRTKVGRVSGCGAVAAANMFAYLAMQNPDLHTLFRNDSQEITVDAFRAHMGSVIRFVAPLSIPGIDIPIGGLTKLSKFARGCEAFAAGRGAALRGVCFGLADGGREEACALVAEQLRNDNPVALLVMQNRKLRRVAHADAYGRPAVSDMRFHWVVITSMRISEGKTLIGVSSEGCKAVLDFADVWGGGGGFVFGEHGLVYLETI
jgi:hypothetical protein